MDGDDVIKDHNRNMIAGSDWIGRTVYIYMYILAFARISTLEVGVYSSKRIWKAFSTPTKCAHPP